MAYHLLTVDHSHVIGDGVQVAPVVRLGRLVDDGPEEMHLMRGDVVELRLPDGQTRQATVIGLGLDGWMKDGRFYTASNPQDPELTLKLLGLTPDDLPAGTEVWLPQRPSGSRPTAGPCSYCQMVQARGDSSDTEFTQ
jgi:hypothetical protein